MKTQTLTNPTLNCNLVIASQPIDFPNAPPIQACSRDYGFDFDEEEVGREFLSPLPASLGKRTNPEIATEEIASPYLWFLS